jgi:hypothetical protein
MINGKRSYNTYALGPVFSFSEPDALTTHRYLAKWSGAAENIQPEKKLMFAVLLDAVESFQKYSACGAKHSRQAEATENWIFKDNHDWAFSFINICDAVGINPQYLRAGLLRWSRERLATGVRRPANRSRCPKNQSNATS